MTCHVYLHVIFSIQISQIEYRVISKEKFAALRVLLLSLCYRETKPMSCADCE